MSASSRRRAGRPAKRPTTAPFGGPARSIPSKPSITCGSAGTSVSMPAMSAALSMLGLLVSLSQRQAQAHRPPATRHPRLHTAHGQRYTADGASRICRARGQDPRTAWRPGCPIRQRVCPLVQSMARGQAHPPPAQEHGGGGLPSAYPPDAELTTRRLGQMLGLTNSQPFGCYGRPVFTTQMRAPW